MGTVREILGAGTFLAGIDDLLAIFGQTSFKGFDFTDKLASIGLSPIIIFILPAGGFFVFGVLMALTNKLANRHGLNPAGLDACCGCPMAAGCKKAMNGEKCESENGAENKPTTEKAAKLPDSPAEKKEGESK